MRALLFLSILTSATSFALEVCPPESTLIEFVSPITKSKKAFCGYQKDGATVKHGEEWTYDSQGTVTKKLYFEHGKESVAPVAAPAATNEAPEEVIAAIKELLGILILSEDKLNDGAFKVKGCDRNMRSWIQGAMLRTPVRKSYSFNDHCDVEGHFEALFGTEFPMAFKLRNLREYDSVNMNIVMDFKRSGGDIHYNFKATKGTLKSPKTTAEFTGEYEAVINLQTRKFSSGAQKGFIHLHSINCNPVNVKKSLIYGQE